MFAATIIIICFAAPSYAATNPLGDALCTVIGWFMYGTVGVGLASLSIFIAAIAAIMQKMTWGMFIFLSLDVVLIYSAGWFVMEFSNGTVAPCFVP